MIGIIFTIFRIYKKEFTDIYDLKSNIITMFILM